MSSSIVDVVETLFDDEKYAEARSKAEAALAQNDSLLDDAAKKQLKLFIRKCNLHQATDETSLTTGKDEGSQQKPSQPDSASTPARAPEPTPSTTTTAISTTSKPRSAPHSARHEWYQSSGLLTFTFYVKGCKQDDVELKATNRSLEVSIRLPNHCSTAGQQQQQQQQQDRAEWIFEPLYMEIKGEEIATTVTPYKVEVRVPKLHEMQWPTLELKAGGPDASVVVAKPVDVLPKTQAELNYPTSSSKRTDWSKVKNFGDEDDGKKEGDEALSALFKKIYANADEDTRRAMVKSYQESGGTTLSTNWENVGKGYVKPEAPKGMEVKTWTEDGI